MLNPLELTGRAVIVTGASSGIGLATAVLLSRLGARVVLAARNPERLAAASRQLEGTGHHVEVFDFSGTGDTATWVKAVAGKTGPLSGIVHCAGVQVLRPLRLLTEADLDTVMKTNVTSAAMLAKGLRTKGTHTASASLVYVSSVMGLVGAAGRSAYSAAKSALHSLTKSLALELAPEGIRVNSVAPGFVRTAMLAQAETAMGAEQMAAIEKLHPLGFGQPEDVAHAVAFLLADTGRWITGTTLVVDGGYTAQ